MNVEIYHQSDDDWRLVNAIGETCILEELPNFFESLDFRTSAGDIVKYKLLFFEHLTERGNLHYIGELYK